MESYLFSALKNAFYPFSLENEYRSAGSWPEDGVVVSESVFFEYTKEPPSGKRRSFDSKKLPAWVDLAALTHDESVSQAKTVQNGLISSAKQVISIWQSELLLGEISDADKSSLKEWITYIKAVSSVDINQAQNITWPTTPAS